jgi:hypothetical protein
MMFDEFVHGKTIAIVGPAPAPYDQSAEVDAHDLVFRTSWGFTGDKPLTQKSDTTFDPAAFPSGYGTRVDVAFYNGLGVRLACEGRLDHILPHLKWALWKQAKPYQPDRKLCQERVVAAPLLKGKRVNVNQVTGMLWDLHHFDPASVTVFGADFYTSPFHAWYDPNYAHREVLRDAKAHVDAARIHDQELQRKVVRRVRELKGWPNGDDRYIKALDMSRDEHQALLDAIDVDGPQPEWAANTTSDALVH